MTEGLFYAIETEQADIRRAVAEGARLIYMENGRPEIRDPAEPAPLRAKLRKMNHGGDIDIIRRRLKDYALTRA
jgi:hypothetical protein